MTWQRRLMPVALMFTPSEDRKAKSTSEIIAVRWPRVATTPIAGRERIRGYRPRALTVLRPEWL